MEQGLIDIDAIRDRRELIECEPAPHPRHDAIVTLSKSFEEKALRLRYVPDRDVILPPSLDIYLAALQKLPQQTLEAISQTILEDINDQVIPSWLEVTVSGLSEDVSHQVRVEDRQPNWKDRGLLDRLEP